MIKKLLTGILLFAGLLAAQATPKKPKLVIAVVVDQFRQDYLLRFRKEYRAGLDRLLTRGAVFTSARYEHLPTVTAPGHSTVLSGATPSVSGIVGNTWYDRSTGKPVTSVGDDATTIVGGRGGAGSSPSKLLVSTVGDELKIATGGKSHVIGISLKDRSAILPAGRMADGAYWFDNQSGSFVSSTYYFPKAPAWVEDFNRGRPGDRYLGAKWLDRTMPADPEKLYPELATSPFGNELIESFSERAIQAEQLGKHDVPDLLAVSFSSNDFVGHKFGPDSPEVHELALNADQQLGKLFRFVDAQIGLDNVLVILTADHGVAPLPEVNAARRMPGGRLPRTLLANALQSALAKKYGDGDWVANVVENSIYLNQKLVAQKNLDPAEVNRTAARALLSVAHVFRVYTSEMLAGGAALDEQVGRRVANSFFAARSGDLVAVLEPYWVFDGAGASHGASFTYDSHVPVIFMGSAIRPGRFYQPVAVNDIAPTVAAILEIETPSGSAGRVLSEIFVP